MLKIQRSSNGGVIFTLIGQIEIEHVVELQRLLGLEEADRGVAFDLKDVTLVNRDAVRFLSQCEAAGIALEKCPPYIREWIDREKKRT
ncbi:MAG TPA: hypothetical protein VKH40_18485 [Alloacidobacterium sp.]|nr:hypothetical protein [Alloacidobacterium sp.]